MEHLIVFTRYPEPGRTKTRLMPALGALGAAQVQRQMTEHTLATVAQLIQQRPPEQPLQVWVCYGGAEAEAMAAWLGQDWCYLPQAQGDLGDRMAQAFGQAFAAGAERVVIIGIDCPDITPEILAGAFEQLRRQDLVLGPASDGGYYLIGLGQQLPSLFDRMAWGGDGVLAETLERAQRAGLGVAQLVQLSDVDYPEDLARWAHHQRRRMLSPARPPIAPLISIVIPVCNEAPALGQVLPGLLDQLRWSEVIVVDGASHDRSAVIAEALGARVIRCDRPQRAEQMNSGAAEAKGEILLFLHGDTQLPQDFETQVRQILAQPGVVAGAFELRIDGEGAGLRRVERGVRWRSRRFQLPYGDQALFLPRAQFEALGGFAPLPIMEDFELVQRLRRAGRIAIAPSPVVTSARRWQQVGVLRTTVVNQAMILAYFLGVSPQRLARWYRSQR